MNRKEITKELLQSESLYDKWLENTMELESDGKFFEEVFSLPLQSEFDIKHLYKYLDRGELLFSDTSYSAGHIIVNGEGCIESTFGRILASTSRLHLSNCRFTELFHDPKKFVGQLVLGDSELRMNKFDMVNNSCMICYNSSLTIENEFSDIKDEQVILYTINGRRKFPSTLNISSKIPVEAKLQLNLEIRGDNNKIKIDLTNFKNMVLVIKFDTAVMGNRIEIIGVNEKNLIVDNKMTSLKNNTLIKL